MAGNTKCVQQLGTEAGENGGGSVTWPGAWHLDDAADGRPWTVVTCAEQDDAISERECFINVMSDEHDRRRASPVDVNKQVLHRQPCEGIQGAKWLVKQEHSGVSRERSSERYTLRHPPRDLTRLQVHGVLKLHEFKQFGDAGVSVRTVKTAGQSEFDIARDSAPRKQPWFLKGNGAPLVSPCDGSAVYREGSCCRTVEATDLPQERRLAAARGAKKGHYLTRTDLEADIAQDNTRLSTTRRRKLPTNVVQRDR